MPGNAPPTPPTDLPADASEALEEPSVETHEQRAIFTDEDGKALLATAHDVLKVLPENEDEAWQKWAHNVSLHNLLLYDSTSPQICINAFIVSPSLRIGMEEVLGDEHPSTSPEARG